MYLMVQLSLYDQAYDDEHPAQTAIRRHLFVQAPITWHEDGEAWCVRCSRTITPPWDRRNAAAEMACRLIATL